MLTETPIKWPLLCLSGSSIFIKFKNIRPGLSRPFDCSCSM